MAEPDIKRVNFFDGLFLKERELQDEQDYHVHMRRRINYMLFGSSGVVQIEPDDLRITPTSAKRFIVTPGMALSYRPDLREGREVILTADSAEFDLSAFGFSDNDEAIVALHYEAGYSEPQTGIDPSTNTRTNEQAVVTAHRPSEYPPSTPLPENEQYIQLGRVRFSDMAVFDDLPADRQTAAIRLALFGLSPAISVSPLSVVTGGTVNLDVRSSGGFDLSTVSPGDVSFNPSTGISGIVVNGNTLTSFSLSFTLADSAPSGPRTLSVTSGATVSTTFSVEAGLSLIAFSPVDVPAGETTLDIDGTGIQAPVSVEFTASGGWTSPVSVPTSNISANRIEIPMNLIPLEATVGPVQVTSSGTPITSNFNVTPPAVITSLSDDVVPLNGTLTISGSRFFVGTEVTLPNGATRGPLSDPPFPDSTMLSEDLSPTTITVFVTSGPQDPPVTRAVWVKTEGGTVLSSDPLTVNP